MNQTKIEFSVDMTAANKALSEAAQKMQAAIAQLQCEKEPGYWRNILEQLAIEQRRQEDFERWGTDPLGLMPLFDVRGHLSIALEKTGNFFLWLSDWVGGDA
jgi:hypothetical protein